MESYITPEAFVTWAAARGQTITAPEVKLTQALDYMALLPWVGEKVSAAQVLDWPRTGVPGVAEDAIPQQVIDAQCRLALAAVKIDLLPNIGGGPQVLEKTLSGVGTYKYAESTLGAAPSFAWLGVLLQGLTGVLPGDRVQFAVRRG